MVDLCGWNVGVRDVRLALVSLLLLSLCRSSTDDFLFRFSLGVHRSDAHTRLPFGSSSRLHVILPPNDQRLSAAKSSF